MGRMSLDHEQISVLRSIVSWNWLDVRRVIERPGAVLEENILQISQELLRV